MSNKKKIGKIKKILTRDIWPNEAEDFTKWLEDNIEYLNDILDFDITIESREEPVGPFNVDLYGEDNEGNKVIIENQLEKTDHDHLGKLITYLTNLEAKVAIWISTNPRVEHVKAIEWLNKTTPADIFFYLIKIETIQIDSQPLAAPLFTIVEGPTEESKLLGKEKKQYAERHILRKEFWGELLEKIKGKTKLFSNISPNIYHWLGTGAGKAGLSYNFIITNSYASCELYIDKGKKYVEPNINKLRFDQLYKNKHQIEKEFGGTLNWERLDNKRASRISIKFKDVGLRDQEKWDKLHEKMTNTMIKFEKAFKNHIKDLDN
jgi:Domain of unknown function (DUF4268)